MEKDILESELNKCRSQNKGLVEKFNELKKKTEATEGLTLAEIYNIDNQQDKSEEERPTIGFKRY